ncbi:MAG TPA: ABC transporter ATP-binding protein [Acidobacteriota bacterium]|nr:ABC transporter ATP-binding protein [Acidobacteriota bacterium]
MRRNGILAVNSLTKTYRSGERQLTVLRDVTFTIEESSTCAIVGPSGSGKTTLLGLCAGLDRPTSGTVMLDGVPLQDQDEEALAELRNQRVGFVFQTFQLIPTLTALENVMVPLELRGERRVAERAQELLAMVGLDDRATHFPPQLSGGEQQRIALARAFVNRPRILFADEPTGNLDEETGEKIEQLILSLNQDAGTTLVLVTHDLELAARTQRIIRLKGGRVVSDQPGCSPQVEREASAPASEAAAEESSARGEARQESRRAAKVINFRK